MPNLKGKAAAAKKRCDSCLVTHKKALDRAVADFNACVKRCQQQLRRDLEHCMTLPPAEQAECRAEAIAAFRRCILRCMEIRDAALLAADATLEHAVLKTG